MGLENANDHDKEIPPTETGVEDVSALEARQAEIAAERTERGEDPEELSPESLGLNKSAMEVGGEYLMTYAIERTTNGSPSRIIQIDAHGTIFRYPYSEKEMEELKAHHYQEKAIPQATLMAASVKES